MKVQQSWGLVCECGAGMRSEIETVIEGQDHQWLTCSNEDCLEFGKRFELPFVEFVEVGA
jgi:hypothetical protein